MFNKTTIIGLIFLIWNFPLFSQIEESNLIKIQNVDSTQMNALTPEEGALIYNSEDKYLYRFDGLNWLPIIKDNLGNHIATENIKLDGHWLSNDGDNEGIFVDPSGKIGIGTNTPSQLLEIKKGHILTDIDYSLSYGLSGNNKYSIYPNRSGMKNLGQLGPQSPYKNAMTLESDGFIGLVETDANDLVGWFNVNNDEFVWDGEISIGSKIPDRALVIGNNVIKFSGANDVVSEADILFNESGNIGAESNMFFGIDSDNNSTGNYFSFQHNSEGKLVTNELMRIQENGNVGIGTSAPKAKLTVENGTICLNTTSKYGGDYPTDNNNYDNVLAIGGIGAEHGLKIYKQNPGSSASFMGNKNYYDAYVFEMTDVNSNNPDGGIVFGATGKDDIFENILTIKGNARIGMGTNNPSQKLHVIGNILASGSVTANSDKRLKKNIIPIQNALEKVQKVNGVSWEWKVPEKHGASEHQRISGVIAQNVEEVMPELVQIADDEIKTKSVNYNGLAAYLIEAIKEQQQRIFLLEKENKILIEKLNQVLNSK